MATSPQSQPHPFFRRRTLALIGLALLLSLGSPAISVSGGPTYTGFDVLIDGWRGVRMGVPAWFANPLVLAAIGFGALCRYRVAAWFATIGLILGLSSLFTERLAQLSGSALPPLVFRYGFYAWLVAECVLCVWCWGRVSAPKVDAEP